jgi:HAE1 family hydrophobic/amphiphilic exporter-1
MRSLPVTQFPDIVPPSVVVNAKYTGAGAEVCAKAVATPIERAINGVPNMTYLNTVTNNNGNTAITVYFKVGTDPDVAAINVQNRVTTVLDELPEEVIKAGVTTEKEVNTILMYLNIFSDDSSADEEFIYNFADINLLKELKRIDGVGFCEIMGSRDYSMRVWLNPDRLVAYKLSTEELIAAIRAQNIEAAPGKTGQSSDRLTQKQEYVLKYSGKFNSMEQYENLVIRSNPDGSLLKLKDIAEIDFGSFDYSVISKTDGRPSATIIIKQRPGSNARDVINAVKAKMEELKGTSFPPGMQYNVTYDVSRFLDASINEVIKTLIEAYILVFIVVFIFLQDIRSTIIPALAVPVSLIGAFAAMQALGFSINLLTLFALVLAIGIVVDNAIVVVEAVHAKMHENGLSPMDATLQSMKEISGAIVSITLIMTAVFIPISFLSGPVGIFYRQFAITLAVAIVISGINALTITPALCSIILKPPHQQSDKHTSLMQRFFVAFNTGYDRFAKAFLGLVNKVAISRQNTLIFLFCSIALSIAVSFTVSKGFIPVEDQGVIYANITTPPGATVDRTQTVINKLTKEVNQIKEVESISTIGGYSLITESTGASYGMGTINLTPWDKRSKSVNQIIDTLNMISKNIADATIEFFAPPTVPGFGNASGFELRLIDKTGEFDFQGLKTVLDTFITALNKRPELANVFSSYNPNFPQYLLSLDQNLAAKNGVNISTAMDELQVLVGSYYTTNFIRFGQMYKVMLQALPEFRTTPESVLKLQVKNSRGEMVPYSNFISIEKVFGPEQLTRYNMYNAAMLNGEAKPGFSSMDAINAVNETAAKYLPKGYTIEWSGISKEEIAAGNEALFIYAIVLIFVYLLLAAQYESLLLPFVVLLALPPGVFGAFALLKIADLDYNIYAQVAIIMLIGLLGKNSILIVEFANQAVRNGKTALEAALSATLSRLRPILMTSLAFMAGLVPLALASGAGELGNRSIGTAALGGMFMGTFLGLFLTPGLFVIVYWLAQKFRKQYANS